jgi:hypothetical protein
MIFTCLSSGSDGNAYLLESDKAVLIIEAGKGTFKKLIAAAPELLSCCEDALGTLLEDGYENYQIVADLKEVIKKVTE